MKKRARIFEILKIDSNSEISKAHEILFHMRNTIHNNGIYTGKNDINYDYAFQIHYFKKGFVHNSANFRTLSFIVRDLIAFYSLVVEDDEIKKIDYIPEVLKISF